MITLRQISHTPFCGKKKMPDRPPPIDEDEFTEVFLKGSGPGGQKINKTSSAVQLRHKTTGIVLKVQETRSREQNRKIAREKLALKVEMIQKGNESRLAVINATKSKRKASALKKSKRKYRMLEEQKEAVTKANNQSYDSNKGRSD
ncbi:putative peptide chain release factor-like protein, mitochondrial [Golovinomyces cichoracearum]|uniref:Putative peptide chain release factor-like protein, mitochondrial n=1 Tax=Golovinomyces cichoracearum TaxID=62708 RepID=A0A420IEZ2_9PEZI|nr:putative peptide chain release factor-like protein, mitochondrial [Golovinomyces cichoracearum]